MEKNDLHLRCVNAASLCWRKQRAYSILKIQGICSYRKQHAVCSEALGGFRVFRFEPFVRKPTGRCGRKWILKCRAEAWTCPQRKRIAGNTLYPIHRHGGTRISSCLLPSFAKRRLHSSSCSILTEYGSRKKSAWIFPSFQRKASSVGASANRTTCWLCRICWPISVSRAVRG